jgi:hypothetical protein
VKAGLIKHLASCLLAANVCACALSTRQDDERARTLTQVEPPAAAPANAPISPSMRAGLDPDSTPEPTEPAVPAPASNHATSASVEPKASSGEPTNTAPGTVACSFEFGWCSPSWLEIHPDNAGMSGNLRSDSHGNMYVVGDFANSVDFGIETLAHQGHADGFVMKLSPSCTPIWVAQYGGNAYVILESIAVDRDDNLIVAGSVQNGSVNLGDGTIFTDYSGHGGDQVGVVLKLDSDGHLLWNRVLRSTDNTTGLMDVGVSDAGDIVVSGAGNSDVHFDGTDAPAATMDEALFVARVSANGEPGAIDLITGMGAFGAIAVDASGRVAISGWASRAMSS